MKYDIDVVLAYYKNHGIDLVAEYKFLSDRDFRFDFLVLNNNCHVAIEVEGLNGRHQQTAGFIEDLHKYNLALAAGYRVVRVLNKDICMDDTVELVKKVMEISENDE